MDKKDPLWIDVHNDEVMRKMGFRRPFDQSPRDKSVWTKTPNERRLLKEVKCSYKNEDMHFHMPPTKRCTVRAKLIVQLKKNKVFPNTTYSFICSNTAVNNILGTFKGSKSEDLVSKYSYNGIAYTANERPNV